MTEKLITYEQRRLTSLVTASEPTRSFERSLRNGVRRRHASPSFSTTTPPGGDPGSILRACLVGPRFSDVGSAQRCWQTSAPQRGRRLARLFYGQVWPGMKRH